MTHSLSPGKVISGAVRTKTRERTQACVPEVPAKQALPACLFKKNLGFFAHRSHPHWAQPRTSLACVVARPEQKEDSVATLTWKSL